MTRARTPLVTVLLDGRALPVDAVTSVRVQQTADVPDQVTVRIADPRHERIASGIAMGAALEVQVDVGSGVAVLARVEVTQVGIDVDGAERTELVVVGLDRGHRLARGRRVRTFTAMDDAGIVRAIAADHGLQADVRVKGVRHAYLLQHGTDAELLDERAFALGCRWWVDGTDLVLGKTADVPSAPDLVLGEGLRSFRMRVSAADGAEEVVVQGWDPLKQQTLSERVAVPTTDLGAGIGTDGSLAGRLVGGSRTGALKAARFHGASAVADAAEARALASALADEVAGEQVLARGEALGDPGLRPGAEVRLQGLAPGLDGRFVISAALHTFGGGGTYLTRFEAGNRRPRSLLDLAGRRGIGSARPSTTEAALVIGIVTNTRDPDKHGRVKVKYPTLSSKDESAWARVASVGAGKERGLHVVPDVGDEVLVGFEHGDLRRPIVLGGLWSGKQGHPVHAKDQTTGAVWTTKAGHSLELSDGQGPADRHFTVTLADGKTTMRVAEDGVEIRTPHGLTIAADKGGEITIKGQLKITADLITLSAKQRLVLEGQRGVSINGGNGPVTVRGLTVEAGGTSKTAVGGAAGVTEVKGSVVKLN